jgi:hypothetical protein
LNSNPTVDARRRGRRHLILIASLFVVPLATAFLLYYSSDWRPVVNARGTLIEPPRPVDISGVRLADGRLATADMLRGRWSVIHPATGRCDEHERALLDELARVRLALDKDADRVRRVLFHDGGCEGIAAGARDADLLVLAATGSAGEAFRAQFPPAIDGAPGIYIVDPHGSLMMSYPASGSARGLLKDLERLLRLSSIG